jgi:hypothetical protein
MLYLRNMDGREIKNCVRCGKDFEYYYTGRGRQRSSCYTCSPPDKRKNSYKPKVSQVEKLQKKSDRSLQDTNIVSYKEIAGAYYMVHITPWSKLRPKESIRQEYMKHAVLCAEKYRSFGERAEIETFLPTRIQSVHTISHDC